MRENLFTWKRKSPTKAIPLAGGLSVELDLVITCLHTKGVGDEFMIEDTTINAIRVIGELEWEAVQQHQHVIVMTTA
jgi:hypothetical protein